MKGYCIWCEVLSRWSPWKPFALGSPEMTNQPCPCGIQSRGCGTDRWPGLVSVYNWPLEPRLCDSQQTFQWPFSRPGLTRRGDRSGPALTQPPVLLPEVTAAAALGPGVPYLLAGPAALCP